MTLNTPEAIALFCVRSGLAERDRGGALDWIRERFPSTDAEATLDEAIRDDAADEAALDELIEKDAAAEAAEHDLSRRNNPKEDR